MSPTAAALLLGILLGLGLAGVVAGLVISAPFSSRILAHHYPDVPNVGDFTAIPAQSGCDLLVGGTPCQSFSVAGLRGGLDDSRGNLALEFMRLAHRLRARWVLWENVPGVLSSHGGRDFGAILGALAELGYGFAYRVLDAQFFGVPQRRRRVFVVGHLGDWRRSAAVLFERESVRRNTPTRRKARAEAARGAAVGVGGGVARTLRAAGSDASEDGTGRGTLIVAFDTTQISHAANGSNPQPGDPSPTLAKSARPPAIAFHPKQDPISGPVSPCLSRSMPGMGVVDTLTAHRGRNDDATNFVASETVARRLTPRECERLQGFPDDYTAIPGASDAARYAALGNSMAVPVMAWIGRRIAFVDSLEGASGRGPR